MKKHRGRPAKDRTNLIRLQIYIAAPLARQIRSILALRGQSQQEWLETVIRSEQKKEEKMVD